MPASSFVWAVRPALLSGTPFVIQAIEPDSLFLGQNHSSFFPLLLIQTPHLVPLNLPLLSFCLMDHFTFLRMPGVNGIHLIGLFLRKVQLIL